MSKATVALQQAFAFRQAEIIKLLARANVKFR